METTRPQKRYHGLDFLRASMMLLGVVIHVAISYTTPIEGIPEQVRWAYNDPNHTPIAGAIAFIIHMFRMPVFFVLSGFFAGMLIETRGTWSFAGNRLARILVPFLIGWFILWPVTMFAASFATLMQHAPPGSDSVLSVLGRIDYVNCLPFMQGEEFLVRGQAEPNLLHLWFLYYLLLFCVITLPIALLLERPAGRFRSALSGWVRRVATGDLRFLRMPILIGVTFLMLLNAQDGPGLDTRVEFVPDLRIFVTYLLFFLAGWVFHRHRELVDQLQPWAWLRLGVGFAFLMLGFLFSLGHIVLAPTMQATSTDAARTALLLIFVMSQAAIAIAMWLMIFGLMGLSERLFTKASPNVRYLVDASYWIYLAHLPLCILLPPIFRDWDLAGSIKMWVVMLLVIIPMLLSYHFLVRATPIGRLLNGRRHPMKLPWTKPNSRSEPG
jgi:glucan biosynthesis protein C